VTETLHSPATFGQNCWGLLSTSVQPITPKPMGKRRW